MFSRDINVICEEIDCFNQVIKKGEITRVTGLTIEASGLMCSVGEICHFHDKDGSPGGMGEVVGFKDHKILLMPYGRISGLSRGSRVISTNRPLTFRMSVECQGRILNGLGQPIDNKDTVFSGQRISINEKIPGALERKKIKEPMYTGVRAIDSFNTVGKGQRIGIFSGSGVGKSMLLGMIARNSQADVNVLALIGERGREVQEFIDKCLGEEGNKRSVLVVVTSDQPAILKLKGAQIASRIAEFFRDQGKNVLLLFDSVTRIAMAQREIGLAIGEPPTTRGYTPSVFDLLPRLLERAGNGKIGSITGLYTVLVEGDDLNEPVSDAVRSILDGHIVLSRDLANKGHFPAIDILSSISRVMPDIVSLEHLKIAREVKKLISIYRDAEDLITIGAYKKGSDKDIDRSIEYKNLLDNYLKQEVNEKLNFQESFNQLKAIIQQDNQKEIVESDKENFAFSKI